MTHSKCFSEFHVLAMKTLADRAKRFTKELEPEVTNIKKLKQIMDDYIDGKLPSIKIVLLQDFSNELGNILNLYKQPEVVEVASEEIEE